MKNRLFEEQVEIKSMTSIFEDSENFKFDSETNRFSESNRLKFIEKFPESRLLSLTIEEYSNINSKDTFTYWLEFKKLLQGISGSPSVKFGIYKSSKDGNYYTGSGKNHRILQGEELDKTFTKLKQGLVEMLNLARDFDFQGISNLGLPIFEMVLIKILCIYEPNNFLQISKYDLLKKCADALSLENTKNISTIELNHLCLRNLQKVEKFQNWEIGKLSAYIWEKFNDREQVKKVPTKYWLYAPGENARFWDEFYEKGIMAIGWDYLGDLTLYESKQEISEKLRILENSSGDSRNNSSANFQFANEISVGDIIIPKRGISEYLGYGIVTSEYFFDDSRAEYKSCRKIDWKKKGSWTENEGKIVLKTLTDITKYPDYVERLKKLIGIEPPIIRNKKMALNQILYGPPGTGKTFNTIKKAVEIICGKAGDSHDENKKIFDELRKKGQIEFVTFHQNYSYEDFVVGIKPDVEFEQLRFNPHKGIFYEIARKSRENFEASKEFRNQERDFDSVFQEVMSPLENGQEVEIRMKSGISFWITDVNSSSISFRKSSGGTAHTLSIESLRDSVSGKRNPPSGLVSYYSPLIELIKEKKVIAGTTETLKNFVLIIDEINRANISKVFGELITLLEDDKRLDRMNELKVTLPNGETDFGIPPNLYIIGTMNTADKSIALIDIALRRRFEFVGFYPDYSLIKNREAADLLQEVNAAIFERKKSADYLIGHAYFMQDNSVENILKYKILPLLMEYFAGKTEIVSGLFGDTNWEVSYNQTAYDWTIKNR